MKLVGVELEKNGRVHKFQAGDLKLEKGDLVVVGAEQGISLGTVVTPPQEEKVGLFKRSLPEVIRKATAKDIKAREKWRKKENEAFKLCLRLIGELKLLMKLVEVEYL